MQNPPMEQMTQIYKNLKAFQKDAKKLARDGWTVQSQQAYQPRAGIGRIALLGGFGALLFRPQTQLSVVYVRQPQQPVQADPARPGYALDGRRLTLKESIEAARQRQQGR